MLGKCIINPNRIESGIVYITMLGLLPTETHFLADKSTYQINGQIRGDVDWLNALTGTPITGYEIHMGQTVGASSWLTIQQRNKQMVAITDGSISSDGRIWGCYVHGIFENTAFRRAWLRSLGWNQNESQVPSLGEAFDKLADVVEAHLNMDTLHQIVGL